MILIGQYDSPFVRRVGIALTLYGLPFEHKPWSTFGDAEKIRPYNPLTRVPTLVLDDRDGIVILPRERAAEIVNAAAVAMGTENQIRTAILGGLDPQEAYLKYGKF